MSLYEVTGRTSYRDHRPGAIFEASLDEQTEARAVRRGAIAVIERSQPKLIEGSYALPQQRKGHHA
jgi:hypothetical protein